MEPNTPDTHPWAQPIRPFPMETVQGTEGFSLTKRLEDDTVCGGHILRLQAFDLVRDNSGLRIENQGPVIRIRFANPDKNAGEGRAIHNGNYGGCAYFTVIVPRRPKGNTFFISHFHLDPDSNKFTLFCHLGRLKHKLSHASMGWDTDSYLFGN